MNRLGIRGPAKSRMGAMLLGALATGAKWMQGPAASFSPTNPFGGSRPTDRRHWHDSSKPEQTARIEAAQLKRQRKAVELHNCTDRATYNNPCLRAGVPNFNSPFFSSTIPDRLHPFYINRETA